MRRSILAFLTVWCCASAAACGANDRGLEDDRFLYQPDSALGAELRIVLAQRLVQTTAPFIAADSLTWVALRAAGLRSLPWRPQDAGKVPRCPWDSLRAGASPAAPVGMQLRLRTERDSANVIFASLERSCMDRGHEVFTSIASWEVRKLRIGWRLVRSAGESIT